MRSLRWMGSAAFLATMAFTMSGCFFIDDDDHHGYHGSAPVVENNDYTYFFCEYDAYYNDYYWEYQASVWDADGLGDIRFVDVTFYDLYSGSYVDQVQLFDEGGGIWGAWSLERETNLWCGEPYEVVFTVEDYSGLSDSLVYGGGVHNAAPLIGTSPHDTWVDCFNNGGHWAWEFQAFVDDMDGFDDVGFVEVTFTNLWDGHIDGSYSLNYEGGGFWGGWIEEGNGNSLYCGESYNVTFYAEDLYGATDVFSFDWVQ